MNNRIRRIVTDERRFGIADEAGCLNGEGCGLELHGSVLSELFASLKVCDVLRAIPRIARKSPKVDGCAVFLMDSVTNNLEIASADGLGSGFTEVTGIETAGTIEHEAMMKKSPVYCRDISSREKEIHLQLAFNDGFRQVLSMPLLTSTEINGAITVYIQGGKELSQSDIDSLVCLGNQAALALSISSVQQGLREEKRMFEAYLFQAPAGIIIGDNSGAVNWCNSSLCSMLKSDREKIVGRNVRELEFIKSSYPDGSEFWARFNQLLQNGTSISREIALKDEKCDVKLEVLREKEKTMGFVCVVSRAKMPEKLETQGGEAIPLSLLHEIAVPLTTIQGFVQLMLEEKVANKELEQYLRIIDREVKRAIEAVSSSPGKI